MKTYFLPLFLVGVSLVAAPSLRADNDATVDQSATATASGSTATAPSTGQQGERMGRFKAALAQLDLTDAQKAQIKQIYTTVTDRKEDRGRPHARPEGQAPAAHSGTSRTNAGQRRHRRRASRQLNCSR
jgi:Spy/CpxP family protein refolding chaperone